MKNEKLPGIKNKTDFRKLRIFFFFNFGRLLCYMFLPRRIHIYVPATTKATYIIHFERDDIEYGVNCK